MRQNNQFLSILPSVPRLFDDFFTKDLFDWNTKNFSSSNTTIPSVNILESNDEYLVEMAAPGLNKKDFKIELKDNVLTIICHHEEKEQAEDVNWLRREFSYQAFQRSFKLNNDVVDDAKIKATYKDGMLQLNIPKKESAKVKPPRLIAIS